MAKANRKSAYEADLRKKLKEAFNEVDTDKSGSISYDELKVMLNKAGYEATDKVAKVGIHCTAVHVQSGSAAVQNENKPICSELVLCTESNLLPCHGQK